MRSLCVLLLCLASSTFGSWQPNIVGWYDARPEYVKAVPPESLDLETLTHLVFGGGSLQLEESGKLECNSTGAQGLESTLRILTKAKNVKMIWMLTDQTAKLVSDAAKGDAFVSSAAAALASCGYDGIEFDWEGPGDRASVTGYTKLLANLKVALGPQLTVAADIAAWTDLPWIDPAMMGDVDFVNLMSYFFDAHGDLTQYQDAASKLAAWKFPPTKINIGLPFYDSAQGAWADLAKQCPDIAPEANVCGNTTFVGKAMARSIGSFIHGGGFAGAFPWQVNYDTTSQNNSLYPWLVQGLFSPVPPPTPAPPPQPHRPYYLPIVSPDYIYKSRAEATAACISTGKFSRLCSKAELQGHSMCDAGWTSDWKGYWMETAAAGCGQAGYNDWSGSAGAFCCV